MQATITNTFHSLPDELKTLKRWLLWTLEERKDKKGNIKYDKVPKQVNGYDADPTKSKNHVTFEQAMKAYYTGKFTGIGFALVESDPYTIIDLDDCFNENREITEKAKTIVDTLDSYTELSQSGNGLHIVVKSDNIEGFNNQQEQVEMYSDKRYFAMTGNVFNDLTAIQERNDIVSYLHDTYKTESTTTNKNEVIEDETEKFSDDELIKKIRNSKQGEKFSTLYDEGDISNYDSDSEADYGLANILAWWTKSSLQIARIMRNSALYREKWDKHPDYLQGRTIQNALKRNAGEGYGVKSNYELKFIDESNQTAESSDLLPQPYFIKYGSLYKTVEKGTGKNKEEVDIRISRNIPFLTKEFSNIERPQVFYEFQWKDRNKTVSEVIPASTIAVRKELLQLSDKGFSVNDNNAIELIRYFDSYLQVNQLEQHKAVERLGSVESTFIHPVLTKDIEILSADHGEEQILDSFEIKGTSESWKQEVFNRIKDQPKALFMVLASFASIIINDLRVQPFIVDLSGSTSQGKTTVLKAASTVWGDNNLVNEWNTTKVAIERKAAYLNNYPLLMDDTRKADERILKDIIYQFSGGRSKGRGSVAGSQKEYTWSNILLSTGEVSLNEYAENAGGAAARVIPLTDEPLRNDPDNIAALHEAMKDNYGAIGVDFLKIWLAHRNYYTGEFHNTKNFYREKSKGNNVLSRLSEYYAAVHFAGQILGSHLNMEINYENLVELFEEIAEETKEIDKPMQFLERILTDLDNKRDSIFYYYEPQNIGTKAVYKEEIKQLYLTPAYLNEFLGIEEKQIRKEWLKRGITIPIIKNGKSVDYNLISHRKVKQRAVALNMDYVESLGFDFHQGNTE